MKIFSKLYSAKYLYKHAPERTMLLNSSQTKKKTENKKKDLLFNFYMNKPIE